MADRIDTHQHFWRYAPETHAWITDEMSALRREFLPDDLKPLLDMAGFNGCIAVQTQQDVNETEWLLSLAGSHDFIRGVVGWVDLRSPDVARELDRLSVHPKFVGVRHVVQDEPPGFMRDSAFRRGIAALEAYDLAYDVLIYERQLADVVELVRAFPRQRFVLDHIGKPDIRAHMTGIATIDHWRRGIAELAANEKVYCKLSGMVTEADWHSWRPRDFVPYLDAVIEAFTPSRCLVGSDWPVCTLAGAYAEVMAIVGEHVVPRDRDAMHDAARASYRLGLRADCDANAI